MSVYDYEMSKEIALKDYSFNSLIMAAIKKADPDDLTRLAFSFPSIFDELRVGYNFPGGK